jgi:hypothetical protein
MADYSYLRKVAARELDQAVDTLDGLLSEDPAVRESLIVAQRDVVGRGDPDFRTAVLAGALSRVVADQQRRLDLLEGKAAQPKRAKQAS